MFNKATSQKSTSSTVSTGASASSSSFAPSSTQKKRYDAITQRRPHTWTLDEVGLWLEVNGLGKHVKQFQTNAISGGQLAVLNENDLLQLKMTNPADRAKFLLAVQQFRLNEVVNDDGGSTSSHSEPTTLGSSTADPNEVRIKFVPVAKGDGEMQVIRVSKTITFEQLKKKAKELYGHRYRFAYVDSDGDSINIRSDDALKAAISSAGTHVLRLHLKRSRDRNAIAADEYYVLCSMLDGVIISDGQGCIKFVNKALEALLGYDRSELVGKNVKVLCPADIAVQHDSFLTNYLTTRIPKVIGIGRDVKARHKSGEEIPVRLSINHSAKGRSAEHHTFMAVLTRLESTAASVSNSLKFQMLDALLSPAFVIDERGTMLYSNNKVKPILGYAPEELVGKNVKMLMTGQDKQNHDQYLASYLTTGVAKVVGKPYRRVVASCKDGRLIAVALSVNVQLIGNDRYFTGVLSVVEEEPAASQSIMQLQRDLIDSLPVPALICDEGGIIQGFNAGAQQMFGYSLIDLVGKNIKVLTPPDIARHHDKYIKNYLTTGKSRILGVTREVAAVRKDGSSIQIRLSVSEKKDHDARIFIAVLQQG